MYTLPFLFIIKNLFTLCHVTNYLLYNFFVFSIFLLISSHLSLFLLLLISSVLYFIPCSLILSHPSALSPIYLCICCSSLYFCLFHCLISLLVSYFLFLLFYPSSCDAFFSLLFLIFSPLLMAILHWYPLYSMIFGRFL